MRTRIQAVSDTLVEAGARTVFGLMGNGNLEFVADMMDRHGVDFVAVRHESAAVAAADGYARAGGGLGIATVTHGPGFTNALTPLVTAHRAGTPLLLVAGTAMGSRGRSTQRLDQPAVARALGIPVVAASRTSHWAADTREALRQAADGPVLLDLPADAMGEPAPPADESIPFPPPCDPPVPDVREAVALLEGAQRPLILAGRGAVRAGLHDALVRLARRFGARLGTSLAAKGLFAGEPADLGIVGGLATEESQAACRSCDVALVVGASLNAYTTEHGTLLGAARIIRLDEAGDPPSTVPVHLSFTGPTAALLAALEAAAPDGTRPPWRVARDGERQPGGRPPEDWPAIALTAIDGTLGRERCVVFDHGDLANAAIPLFAAHDPSQSLVMLDFGSLGLSLAAAIGAASARPDRPTLAVLGDGGLMMSAGELDTVGRLCLPVTIVALNDGAYGAELPHLARIGASPAAATFDSPPLAGMARAMGLRAVVLRGPSDLPALPAFDGRSGPVLVEILCGRLRRDAGAEER